MKNLKTLLIPVGLIVLVVGVFSFTNPKEGNEDKKCKVKIVKIINGEKTVIDSTFNCDENTSWIEKLHEGIDGEGIHEMIKVMMMDGDSGTFDFNFDMDINGEDENGVKIMKFKAGDGEEDVEMNFDFNMLEGSEGEDGVIKMMVNGEEMEINVGDIHKHIEHLGENIDIEATMKDVEVLIESNEEGEEAHSVKIIKTVDENGNVTMKKIVDGEEMELDDEELGEGHKIMFIGEDGKITGKHNVSINVDIDDKNGEEMKKVVVISKVVTDERSSKKRTKPASASTSELSLNKLKFSPNPSDGKFDLSFKLDSEKPVGIRIVDVQGKVVYSEMVSDFNGKYLNSIDISDKGEGIYFVQIVQDKKTSSSKIVIK